MSATRTRILGTTRILEPIGQGGMAEVYRGVQRTLQRPVAVKVMLPRTTRQRELVTRFRREALAIGAMQHENIVAVHDLIEKNEQLFLIMEYVDGVDLGTLLAPGPVPIDIALIVGGAIARALEHAHFRNVIHRDIKPANVMISRHGEVKLTDFGIAKDLTTDDLTRTGLIVGTPAFVAPERITGKRVDGRSDIYSLGVLLFQAISGHRPYRAKQTEKLFEAISKGDRQRLRALAPDCPRGVEQIVDKCLELDPEKRWRRASELRAAIDVHLRRMLDGTPAARMVSYLYTRGLTDEEHLLTLDVDEIAAVDPTIAAKITEAAKRKAPKIEITFDDGTSSWRRRGLRAVLALVLLLVIGAGAAFVVAPQESHRTLDAAVRFVRSRFGG